MGHTVWSVLLHIPCDPSSLQLLDILCSSVHPVANWDAKVGEVSVVLFVPLWDRVEDFFIRTDPLLQVLDALLVTTPLLSVVGVALLEGDSEATRDGSKRVGVDLVVAIQDSEG